MYKILERSSGKMLEVSEPEFVEHIKNDPDAARGIFSDLTYQGSVMIDGKIPKTLLTEDVIAALVEADPAVIHMVPMTMQTKEVRRIAIDKRPDILLTIKNPDRELIAHGINTLCDQLNKHPSLNTRGITANFIQFLNGQCREPEFYAMLMEINAYPWRSIPKECLNSTAASYILNDFPESLTALSELDLDMNTCELILNSLIISDDLTKHNLLQHATRCEVMTPRVVWWVLAHIGREQYPENLVELLESKYRRDYGVKKLKEPN